MNELKSTLSPYLLQHASNPVHWKNWSNDIFKQAKKENKLLLISIGYSTCHWCHVMERECFEDIEVADLMNKHFISVKIDREEHPDIDAVYMKALQLMTQQGGWPLNIVALPDGRPIWGATYVNKSQWIHTLTQLHLLHKDEPHKMYEYAEKLHEGLKIISTPIQSNPNNTTFSIEKSLDNWKKNLDFEWGGTNFAPKFMMPSQLNFLQSFAQLYNNNSLLQYIDTTLTRMAWGGIFDTIGGGFSRYSVDHYWHIPHFEKMLYDNALLLKTYSDAYKRTQNTLYLSVIEKTFNCIIRDFKSKNGGYFCAWDADSKNQLQQIEEGAFYTWSFEELKQILNVDFPLFQSIFNINETGYWEEVNKYVLFQTKPLESIANEQHISVTSVLEKKIQFEKKLFEHREKRTKPSIDDKILTSWNALLLYSFVEIASIIGKQKIEPYIHELSDFIEKKLCDENQRLAHTFKNQSYIDGIFEDYAFCIYAYLKMYEYSSDKKYLSQAKQWTDLCLDIYFDLETGFFKSNESNKTHLIEQYDIEDNVIPSTNAIMCQNLFRLYHFTYNQQYLNIAQNMKNKVLNNNNYFSSYSQWLSNHLLFDDIHFKEVKIVGKNAIDFYEKIQEHYLPQCIFSIEKTNEPTYFQICTNSHCGIPTENFQQLLSNLLNKSLT